MPTHRKNASLDRLKSGLQHISEGKYQFVHTEAINMIKKNVRDAVPYCLLGTIAADHGNHLKACELFERAANLEPESPVYHAFHGKALTTLGHQNLAKKAADRAAAFVIDDAYVADTVGVIYSRTGFHEKAITLFETAVALNPEPANYHYNLAASQQFLGNFAAAETAYARTLDRDPAAYRAWSSMVGLHRQTEEKNQLATLYSLFDQLSSDADAALHLGHAIAKTLEDLGRYEESLAWLHKAKRGKQAEPQGHFVDHDSLFAAARSTAGDAGNNNLAASPIFIVGLPRTGTTLVDRIFSSHSQVTSAGELNVFPGLVKEGAKTPSNLVLDSDTLLRAGQLDLEEIGASYMKHTRELARGAPRITDKMPLNFFYAGLIHRALPNARIIALRRGAMDSCVSNYRQLLTVQHSYYHYTYDLEATAAFYRQFDSLMAFWKQNIPADRFTEVRYEDIIENQEQETRRLLSFCDLDFEEACMRFHENAAPVSTASSVQVRQPLYSSSVGRWKRYGDKLDGLRQALGDLAESD